MKDLKKNNQSEIVKQNSEDSEEALLNENRGFFCSELVAKCYKEIGLFNPEEPDQASSNFLPVHLSSDNFTLPMRHDIYVNTERFILPELTEEDKKVAQ